MKFKFALIALLSFFYSNAQTPRAGGINNSQATVLPAVHDNFTGVQSMNNNAFAVYDFATNFTYYFGLKNTDNLAQGLTNKYYSSTLARNDFSAGFGLNYSAGVYSLDSTTQGILSAVSGKYNNPTGTTLQYIDGTGALRTFPSVPSAQINSDWNSVNGVSQILNKPTIPTDNNQLTNGSGYITASSVNNLTNKSGNISQWTNNTGYITGIGSFTTSNLNEGTNLYYTDTRSRNAISAGSGISYNATTGVITNASPSQVVTLTAGNRITITGTYPNFTISYVEPTINTGVVRALNSNFTVSATKQALVTYTLTCSVTNPLLVGTSTAMAYLEYSTNGGTTWLLPSQNGNSSGVGITVTLQLTNGQTGTLIGYIPANALVRIRTSTTGTGSVVYVTGQENY